MAKPLKPRTDDFFEQAGTHDPYIRNDYFKMFMTLELADRRRIARQAAILTATIPGLDFLGALEVLYRLGRFLAKGGDL